MRERERVARLGRQSGRKNKERKKKEEENEAFARN